MAQRMVEVEALGPSRCFRASDQLYQAKRERRSPHLASSEEGNFLCKIRLVMKDTCIVGRIKRNPDETFEIAEEITHVSPVWAWLRAFRLLMPAPVT